ncbi:hypothetical protein ACTXT7_002095 [Hymenolepis weldensis]
MYIVAKHQWDRFFLILHSRLNERKLLLIYLLPIAEKVIYPTDSPTLIFASQAQTEASDDWNKYLHQPESRHRHGDWSLCSHPFFDTPKVGCQMIN